MKHLLRRGLLPLLLAVALGWAQTGTGSIQGTVRDATGAVLPGAKLTLTHTQTTRQYTTTSTEVGFYLFPSVQTGAYQIRVEAPGMETWQGDLVLQVGQTAEVNPTLKVGATVTEITVAGNVTPLVTTTSPTLANVVERARIEQLPLNGRFIQNLFYMTTPGFESGSVPRVFGLRYATELLQDGAVLANRQWQQIPARPPGLDTIDEFRAETNNSSAKMNRPGTIILTTRAGTNDIHGAVFETARNSAIGVARARQDFYLKPPHLVRNEFGASLGGPVYLPKLYNGTNRTFFFFAYEGYRQRQASTRSVSMPTQAMQQGDFSGLIDAQGRRYTLYDPLTTQANWSRQPFPNNQIPVSRRSPLATYLYSVTPLPTHTAVNPLQGPNWFGTGFNNHNQHTETVRVDHRLSDRDQLFFRYTHAPAFQRFTTSLGGGANHPRRPRQRRPGRQRERQRRGLLDPHLLPHLLQRDHRQRAARLQGTPAHRRDPGDRLQQAGASQPLQRPGVSAHPGHRFRHGLRFQRQPEYRLQPHLRHRRESHEDLRPSRISVRRALALRVLGYPARPAGHSRTDQLQHPRHRTLRPWIRLRLRAGSLYRP
jgi:hypothetical protein